MKNLKFLITVFTFVFLVSCKKDDPLSKDNYSSIDDFFLKNQVPLRVYFINNGTGGSFTTPQGTRVDIPTNAFTTTSGLPVNGNIAINFKDIYKKSDMLLSNLHTMTFGGQPLKSGGEFFIDAFFENSIVELEKKITITQPASLTGGIDTVNIMKPFILDSFEIQRIWIPSPFDSVNYLANGYIFSLYTKSGTGTWGNSDNSTYFNKFAKTTLTLISTESISKFNTQVFLLFDDLTSMVHVYDNSIIFPYYYAPLGLKCTLVAVGVNNGVLYSYFQPITISPNQVINFTLQKTTTDAFKKQLKALD